MRDYEGGTRVPHIDAEAMLALHRGDELAVDDPEGETELGAQFVLPLQGHGGGRGDQREIDAPAQQKLAQDQARFDGLAESNVVGDQEIDARQLQRLDEWQELIGIEADAGAKRLSLPKTWSELA